MIKENDYVLLILPKKRAQSWLVKIDPQARFHSHQGWIDISDLIGKDFGSRVTSSTGATFLALKPRLKDFIQHSRKIAQIIYPDDALSIIGAAGLKPGSQVIELTGSGGLTAFLAQLVQPGGHVYSYDLREKHINTAKKNLERIFGLNQYVTFKKRDILDEGFDEKYIDAIILDMPNPWEVLSFMWSSLKPGGIGIFFLPNWTQVQQTIMNATSHGFWIQEIFEISRRNYLFDVSQQVLRPETRGILFTGIIIAAQRLADQKGLHNNNSEKKSYRSS